MQVWINGRFVDGAAAQVSVFDAGLQHAVGLFETMAARHGRVFRVHDHLERLAHSARELQLTERLHTKPLADAVKLALDTNGMEEARIRLTVTGGNLAAPAGASGAVDPTTLIVVQPPTPYADAMFQSGVMVTIADGRLNPLDPAAGHKTLDYWSRIRALQAAAARGAGEALWFTVSNHLCGGSVSNAFLVKDDTLLTPIARGEEEPGALRAPVLPGITRMTVLEAARRMGLAVEVRQISIEDLLSADEAFLTNSSWGVLPVVAVERERIGDGTVGSTTLDLRAAWQDAVERDTTAAPEA